MQITKRGTDGRISKGSNLIHGLSNSPEYDCWIAMKARCNKPNHPEYFYYGGRGITVCANWIDSFNNFYSDMGARPKGGTIERRDVNGNYEPNNCVWASINIQQLNRRNSAAFPGISYEADRDSYNVRLKVNGVRTNVGRYRDLQEAVNARLEAEVEHGIHRYDSNS